MKERTLGGIRGIGIVLLLLGCGASAPSSTTGAPSVSGEGGPCGMDDPLTPVCQEGLTCCGGPTSPNIGYMDRYAGWCARTCPDVPVDE